MAPRPTISLSTFETRTSDNNEDVSSARGAEVEDDFGLVEQLHHRLLCLPPVDTGKDAYLFLLACFVLSALVWSESAVPLTTISSHRQESHI